MIYLNNAATSYPKPDTVLQEVSSFIASCPYVPHTFGTKSVDPVQTSRQRLADFFNAPKAEDIIFTSGSTEAFNLIINGLSLHKQHVIITATEHNSVIRPLKHLERNHELELSIAACDKEGFVQPETIRQLIQTNTKAVFVNHCSNVTGSLQDVEAIAKVLHNSGILLIADISQSAGAVPIDVQKMGADIVVFTGHKSLYGMKGTGGFYLKDGIRLKPLKFGGTGVQSESLYQPAEKPLYYEAGTQNIPGIVSMRAGVDFINKVGIENIKAKKDALTQEIIDTLSSYDELCILGSKTTNNRNSTVSFLIQEILPERIGIHFAEKKEIILRAGLHCAPLIHKYLGTAPAGTVRVSPSYFTTNKEIAAFKDAIADLVFVLYST